MRMGIRSLGPSLLAAATLVLTACADTGNPTTSFSPTPPASAPTSRPSASTSAPSPSETTVTCDAAMRVALITDVGGIDDMGYSQSAYEGMEAAAAAAPTCFETAYLEITGPPDYETHLAELTGAGYDVIIGVGLLASDPLGDAAERSPDTTFIAVDTIPTSGHNDSWNTNGQSLFFAEDQAGYLAGVLAASLSESNHIGVVGSFITLPPVERFVEGYASGAKDTRPAIDVDVVYTNSLGDPLQGRNAATHLISQGADVMFTAGGLTGTGAQTANGALLAACAAGVWAIGAETDLFLTLKEARPCLVSSATKNVTGAVRDALLRFARGDFEPGIHVDDASTNGIGLAPFRDHEPLVPDDVRALLQDTLAGLADGSIEPDVTIDSS